VAGSGRAPTGRTLQDRYEELLEHLRVGVYTTTAEGAIVDCNHALARILGYRSAASLRQHNAREFYVRQQEREEFLARMNAGESQPQQYELRRRDGRVIFVRDYARAVFDAAGKLKCYDGIIVDITAHKQVEDALRESEREYRQLFENAHDAIMIFSVQREIILDVNQRACELYGFSRDALIGMSLESISRDVKLGKTRIRKTLAQRTYRNFETVHFRKDGGQMIVEINAAVVDYRGVPSILSINRDVTERKKMEESIRELAFHDPLTGLPNRKLLLDRLELALLQAQRHKRKTALLFLDLDGFKQVNDRFGHDAGDRMLVRIAHALTKALRRSDTVARLGGDEFVVLVPEVRSEKALVEVAGKILQRVREVPLPAKLRAPAVRITTSIGIALCPRDGNTSRQLLKAADAAMYKAKTLGKDRFALICPALSASCPSGAGWCSSPCRRG